MLTSIIILTYNAIECTKMCAESIKKYTDVPYELIFIDNGSTDGTIEYLNTIENARIIVNGQNLGFAKGNNQGLEIAKGDYIVFMNNDVIVTDKWLSRMIDHAQSDPQTGMVGPLTNRISGVQEIDVNYGDDMAKMQEFAIQYTSGYIGKEKETTRLVAFCVLVKKEVIDKIGGFDERFLLGNFEDDDLCIRTKKAGFRLVMAHDSFVHHFQSKTFKVNKINYYINFMQNRQRFLRKWQNKDVDFSLYAYSYTFPAVQKLIPADVRRLLDVGCIMGDFGIELREQKGIEVTGIEIDPIFANVAKKQLDKVITGDVETLKLDKILTPSYFDCVTMVEILEHLTDPALTIYNLAKYIRLNGYFILLFPNMLYFETIKDLLEGNWQYKDYGALASNHKHLFTMQDIQKMLEDAGLYIQNVFVNDKPMPDDMKNIADDLSRIGLRQLKENGDVYEYVVIARKIHEITKPTTTDLQWKKFMKPDLTIYNDWQDKTVLEIGLNFGPSIKKAGAKEITGVNVNAQQDKSDYDMIIPDFQSLAINIPHGYFDYIIINDFEKIYEIENLISSLKQYLKNSGRIIFDFVNFRNFSTLADILGGNGLYKSAVAPNDLMLYTLKSITGLMDKNGFNANKLGEIKYETENAVDCNLKKFTDILSTNNIDISTFEQETKAITYIMEFTKKGDNKSDDELKIDVEYFSHTDKVAEIDGRRNYNFLCIWDDMNIGNLIKAFVTEFKPDDDLALIINLNDRTEEYAVEKITEIIGDINMDMDNIPDIILLKDKVYNKDLPKLMKAGNCFISIHSKDEENKFYSIAAMAMNLPVISCGNCKLKEANLHFYCVSESDMMRKYMRQCYEGNYSDENNYLYVKKYHDFKN